MTETINYTIHPSEYVNELLEIRNMSQEELASRSGVSAKHISNIVNGKVSISPDVAIAFENVFGTSSSYWLKLQNAYDDFMSRIRIEQDLQEHEDWVRLFDYASLLSYKVVDSKKDIPGKGAEILRFFGVKDYSSWEKTWSCPIDEIYCRSTNAVREVAAPRTIARLATWIRLGQLKADQDITDDYPDFNSQILKNSLLQIRALNTLTDPKILTQKLGTALKQVGVFLQFMPAQAGMMTYAATFLVKNNRIPCIQLSLRGKTHDQLWFSLMHEIYHLLTKGNRQGFLIGESSNPHVEEAADRFAAEVLIDPNSYQEFVKSNQFDIESIQTFAALNGIDAGIVVGRLQFDKKIAFNTFNNLKKRYQWG